jgi:ABC-type glycerol-3-phosphate transport system substrate-binding protein
MTRTRIVVVAGIAVATALLVAGLAGARTSSTGRAHQNLAVSGTITFDGIWTASSGQKQFADVIAAFNEKYPNVKVR